MQQPNDSVFAFPEDVYERERLENFHPARWRNPKLADPYTLVVIGAGPAGITAAHSAASLGVKVALIERTFIGGTCMNVGCSPSKTLIRTSHLYADMRNAELYGAQAPVDIRVNFPAIMERMRRIRARLSRAESVHRLAAAGVDVFFGNATFIGTDSLTVDGVKLRFKKAMIATGARPDTPSIPALLSPAT